MAERIADRYDLTTLIGRGPHASVWRARQVDSAGLVGSAGVADSAGLVGSAGVADSAGLVGSAGVADSAGLVGSAGVADHGEDVALKVLNARFARDPKVLERLEQDRRVFAPVVHPAFVRLHELIVDVEVALVIELVNGADLRGPDVFAFDETVDIANLVASALAAAHAEGVVHGDVKPSNLLVTRLTGDLRITDCGLAHVLRGYRVGPTRFADPRYAAPEVILGGEPAPASDIYQLGLVVYEMLTGAAFIDGDDPMNVLSKHLAGAPIELPDRARPLQGIVRACLSTDPAARPKTGEVVEELRRVRRLPASESARSVRESRSGAATAESSGGTKNAQAFPRSQGLPTAWGPGTSQAVATADDDTDRVPSQYDLIFPAAEAIDGDSGPDGDFPVRVGDSGEVAYRYTQPNPRRSRRRLVVVSLAALLVGAAVPLLVRGVGDNAASDRGQDGTGTPGAAASPTTPPSEVPRDPDSPPTPPPTSPTADGASAFVRYWFATLNFATSTGDLAPMQAASDDQCQACSAAVSQIRGAYVDGGRLRGGQYSVRDVSADDFFTTSRPVMRVVFDRSPRSAIGRDGQLLNVVPGTTFASCQVVLELADGWTVRDVSCATPLQE